MSTNFTPTPEFLRELLPSVARHMDRDFITEQVRDLNIKFKARVVKGCLVLEIPMEPNHMMRVTPVVDNSATRNLYVRHQVLRPMRGDDETPTTTIQETIAAQVEVFDKSLGEKEQPVTFTLQKKNMEAVLTAGMLGFYRLNGTKMMPIKLPGIRRRQSN
jgi:hypothetical protein